jgi:hypothetical protein
VSPPPTPAIVTQAGVKPIPRWALLALCAAYVLPGWLGRSPWKSADLTAFGYMLEMAQGYSAWTQPLMAGLAPDWPGLLPYWLGAFAIQSLPFLGAELAARAPFALLLALCMVCTWYAIYYLARDKAAQPVAFAFGGEADPVDYARAMADGGLLALMACLGLAQLSHETTPALVQLAGASLVFFGLAALPYRRILPWLAIVLGLLGLVLSGAPAVAGLLALAGAGACLAHHEQTVKRWALPLALAALGTVLLTWSLGWLSWRVEFAPGSAADWRRTFRLLAWFVWPAWPLALWTLWRWRKQLINRHLLLPLALSLVVLGSTLAGRATDRALLLGLPSIVALAAFALPTLKRSFASLIDWFTLLFFSGCALIIWVIWIANLTGVPAKPAANVQRLAPGFQAEFSITLFLIALCATFFWVGLVFWRAQRQRNEIWRSLVLPASGAVLCWLLLMTLWLGMLDYARSYAPFAARISTLMEPASGRERCVQALGLTRAQVAALQHHVQLRVEPSARQSSCRYLLVDPQQANSPGTASVAWSQWTHIATVARPSDAAERLVLLRRTAQP